MRLISEKIIGTKILKNHWGTFHDLEGNRTWEDVITFYALPLVLSVAFGGAVYFRWIAALPHNCWSSSLTMCSVLIPLSVTTIISLCCSNFNGESDNERVMLLVQELRYNAGYVIYIAMLQLLFVILVQAFELRLSASANGIFVFLFSHLVLSLLLVIKRAYCLQIRR